MDISLLLSGVEGVETYIISAAIALARMTGLVMIMPAFTRVGLSGILRSGVALVLALPLFPMIFAEIAPQTMPFAKMAALLFKEVAVGVTMGVILGVPIWAAEVAGEILDLQRGVTFAETVDPQAMSTGNITGTLFSIVIVAIYFVSGGLSQVLEAAYNSYTLWPLTSFMPIFSAESGLLFLNLLDEIMGKGLMLVIPIVIALLLSDLSLALVARAVPQMNIFILSLTVKNFVYILLLVIYATFLVSYMRDNLSILWSASESLKPFAPHQN